MAIDFEKLGVFYLGRLVDPKTRKRGDEPLLYDARDLVTHAVCVGMTGSGKTGLCLGLLEEAALDSVPAIVIDPKGDLGNLLLTFPDLAPGDFRPWINEDDARRQGVAPDAWAAQHAALWRKGLADWGQDGERIRRLREAAEFAIYTPGSSSGRPVSVLSSFAAPPPAVLADEDTYRQRLVTAASSLLGLLGIDADPLRSREHILLSNLFDRAWRAGEDLDIAMLVAQVQQPPLERVGVMDLDSFFPARDRFAFAMSLNNLLASPSFAAWAEGDPLDVAAFLHDRHGKPRVSIFSIAHLGDAERMFFVSLLLSQVISWMRSQPGTTSLRAILYMDEVFGFLPPVANPPSKQPFLLLLKQARAFGLGVVVSTQNPVDLDYKALSNAGTWFLGRLQTERDKERVLEGLEGAASAQKERGFDRQAMDHLLAGLGKRVFLMQNAHDEEPTLFETRWAMSYLRGPLTLPQIQTLTARPQQAPAAAAPRGGRSDGAGAGDGGLAPARARPGQGRATRPPVPPEIEQVFLPAPAGRRDGDIQLRPAVLGSAAIRWSDPRMGVEWSEVRLLLAPFDDSVAGVDWSVATRLDLSEADLETRPPEGISRWAEVPPAGGRAKSYAAFKKSLADELLATATLELWQVGESGPVSRPGESEREFRLRAAEAAREGRDDATEKVRRRYATRVRSLEEKIRRAEGLVEREKSQAASHKIQAAVSVGATVLGALFGRRRVSVSRASTAVRGVGRAMDQSSDVGRAEENLEALRAERERLEREIEAELGGAVGSIDPSRLELRRVALRPKKAWVDVRRVALAWTADASGNENSAGPA